jgi:hypothetical protein
MWEPRRLTTLCAFTACYRDSFTFKVVVIPRALAVGMVGDVVNTATTTDISAAVCYVVQTAMR